MTDTTATADILLSLWAAMDARDWDGVAATLHPDFRAAYSHTGETFDRASFLALNRDYPGAWRCTVEDHVAEGARAATRTRVHNDEATYFVASFAGIRDGLVATLVEVWADGDATPPEHRPAAPDPEQA